MQKPFLIYFHAKNTLMINTMRNEIKIAKAHPIKPNCFIKKKVKIKEMVAPAALEYKKNLLCFIAINTPPTSPAEASKTAAITNTGRTWLASRKDSDANIPIISLLNIIITNATKNERKDISLNTLLKNIEKPGLSISSSIDIPQAFENTFEIILIIPGNLFATANIPIAETPRYVSIIGLFIPFTNHHIIVLGIKGKLYESRVLRWLPLMCNERNLYDFEKKKENKADITFATIRE